MTMKKFLYLLTVLLIVFTYNACCLPKEADNTSSDNDPLGNAKLQGGSHAGNPAKDPTELETKLEGGTHAGNPFGFKVRDIVGKVDFSKKGGCQADKIVFQLPGGKSIEADLDKDGSFIASLEIDHAYLVNLFYKGESMTSMTFHHGPDFPNSSFMYVSKGKIIIDLKTITCEDNNAIPEVEPSKSNDQDQDGDNDYDDEDDDNNGVLDIDEIIGAYVDGQATGNNCLHNPSIVIEPGNFEIIKDSSTSIIVALTLYIYKTWTPHIKQQIFMGAIPHDNNFVLNAHALVLGSSDDIHCVGSTEELMNGILTLECSSKSGEVCTFNNYHKWNLKKELIKNLKEEQKSYLNPGVPKTGKRKPGQMATPPPGKFFAPPSDQYNPKQDNAGDYLFDKCLGNSCTDSPPKDSKKKTPSKEVPSNIGTDNFKKQKGPGPSPYKGF